MLVRQCMTPSPVTVKPEEDVKSVYSLLRQRGFRQIPVVKDGIIVGMVTERDLRDAPARLKTVGEVMSYDPVTVSADTEVEEAARIIHNRKITALLIISQKNELVGIMTITDVLDGLLYLLESHKGQMEEKISGF